MLFLQLLFSACLSLALSNAPAEPQDIQTSADTPNEQKLMEEDSLSIFRHKPIYFAYNNPLTKVQFSFRSPIIRDQNFYFAYSQVIFWQLLAESKPFLDATYNPEFFYRLDLDGRKTTFIDFGIWEHNSNGQDGITSRSYDQSYVRANYAWDFSRWILMLTGKVRYLYNADDDTKEIIDYSGPVSLELKLIQLYDGWIDKSEFTLSLHPGGKFSEDFKKGGYQIGYSFRLGKLNLVPAFYIQYYEGYAETLLTFDERVSTLRAGFIF